MKRDETLFSASEIGQFTFCSVSWFLKRKGYRSPHSKKKSHGMQIHNSIGKKTYILRHVRNLSYVLIVSGSVLILIFLLIEIGFIG